MFLRAFLIILTLLSSFRAHAQEAVSLPDHVKKPLTAFLSATGWKNAEQLAEATRYWQLTDLIFVIRVAGKSTCDMQKDLCLTIIGSLRNSGFVAESVFYAGGKVEASNSAYALGGSDGPSLFFVRFYGKKQNLTAMPAPTGWIVIPSAALDDFKGR
jgi:hypothetical protein